MVNEIDPNVIQGVKSAIGNGDLQSLKDLVEGNADLLTYRDESGDNLLNYAINNRNFRAFEYLVKDEGMNPYINNSSGVSPANQISSLGDDDQFKQYFNAFEASEVNLVGTQMVEADEINKPQQQAQEGAAQSGQSSNDAGGVDQTNAQQQANAEKQKEDNERYTNFLDGLDGGLGEMIMQFISSMLDKLFADENSVSASDRDAFKAAFEAKMADSEVQSQLNQEVNDFVKGLDLEGVIRNSENYGEFMDNVEREISNHKFLEGSGVNVSYERSSGGERTVAISDINITQAAAFKPTLKETMKNLGITYDTYPDRKAMIGSAAGQGNGQGAGANSAGQGNAGGVNNNAQNSAAGGAGGNEHNNSGGAKSEGLSSISYAAVISDVRKNLDLVANGRINNLRNTSPAFQRAFKAVNGGELSFDGKEERFNAALSRVERQLRKMEKFADKSGYDLENMYLTQEEAELTRQGMVSIDAAMLKDRKYDGDRDKGLKIDVGLGATFGGAGGVIVQRFAQFSSQISPLVGAAAGAAGGLIYNLVSRGNPSEDMFGFSKKSVRRYKQENGIVEDVDQEQTQTQTQTQTQIAAAANAKEQLENKLQNGAADAVKGEEINARYAKRIEGLDGSISKYAEGNYMSSDDQKMLKRAEEILGDGISTSKDNAVLAEISQAAANLSGVDVVAKQSDMESTYPNVYSELQNKMSANSNAK